MSTHAESEIGPVHITLTLRGEPAERFLRHKRRIHLENNSEVARQLMFSRLDEIEAEEADEQ